MYFFKKKSKFEKKIWGYQIFLEKIPDFLPKFEKKSGGTKKNLGCIQFTKELPLKNIYKKKGKPQRFFYECFRINDSNMGTSNMGTTHFTSVLQ